MPRPLLDLTGDEVAGDDAGRLAVLDDEAIVRRELVRSLKKEGYETEPFADGESVLERLTKSRFDLLLCDLRLPGLSGMDVMKAARVADPSTEVIILTGFASVESAIAAIRANGKYDEISKKYFDFDIYGQ